MLMLAVKSTRVSGEKLFALDEVNIDVDGIGIRNGGTWFVSSTNASNAPHPLSSIGTAISSLVGTTTSGGGGATKSPNPSLSLSLSIDDVPTPTTGTVGTMSC